MRLLLTSQPAYGHLFPLLPVAHAARAAGHDVAIATSELFSPAVESAGFRALAAGMNWLEADKSTVPAELRPSPGSTLEQYFAQQFVRASALPMAADLIRLAQSWRPDVIVRDRTEFGGAIAADAIGAPSCAIQVGNPSLITAAVLEASEEPFNQARMAVGLGRDPGMIGLEGRPVLMFAPPGVTEPAIPLPRQLRYFRPTALDHDPSDRLPDWATTLGDKRPVVYATLGTVFNNPAYELPFFPSLLNAVRDEPLDVVVTVGPNVEPTSLVGAPANVRVERFVPQSVLFPRVGLVISHGGFGTVLAAIEHGIPLIVVPFGADQHLNAAAVERLGIGIAMDADGVEPRTIRTAIRRVLGDPSYRESARRLQAAAAALPSVDAAVQLIADIASGDGSKPTVKPDLRV
jgi:UDP:flavonoid glycosyltransferase YjiC (YdhE family)